MSAEDVALARSAYERLSEHDLEGKASWWGAFRTREEALEAVRSLAA